MTKVNRAWFASGSRRAGARRIGRNPRARRGIGAASARENKSFKTKPILPSLPNGAARCALARSGAQRARDQKSAECRIFSCSVSMRPWRHGNTDEARRREGLSPRRTRRTRRAQRQEWFWNDFVTFVSFVDPLWPSPCPLRASVSPWSRFDCEKRTHGLPGPQER